MTIRGCSVLMLMVKRSCVVMFIDTVELTHNQKYTNAVTHPAYHSYSRECRSVARSVITNLMTEKLI